MLTTKRWIQTIHFNQFRFNLIFTGHLTNSRISAHKSKRNKKNDFYFSFDVGDSQKVSNIAGDSSQLLLSPIKSPQESPLRHGSATGSSLLISSPHGKKVHFNWI